MSKFQSATKLPTSKAEVYAFSECVQGVVWLQYVSTDMGLRENRQPIIYQEIHVAISKKKHPQRLRRVEHIFQIFITLVNWEKTLLNLL